MELILQVLLASLCDSLTPSGAVDATVTRRTTGIVSSWTSLGGRSLRKRTFGMDPLPFMAFCRLATSVAWPCHARWWGSESMRAPSVAAHHPK